MNIVQFGYGVFCINTIKKNKKERKKKTVHILIFNIYIFLGIFCSTTFFYLPVSVSKVLEY